MKKSNNFANPILIYFLALLFTIALMFLIIEVPKIIHEELLDIFPDIHPVIEPDEVSDFLNLVRPIGYISLIIILVLVISGFVINKTSLSSTSSFILFLPTFGQFILQMFFLAGLGILQILWLPLDTPSINLLNLGYIINIPYLIIAYLIYFLFPLSGPSEFLDAFTYGVIWLGLFIFILGIIAWFKGSYKKKSIVDFSIYKYSRHPQYLGFLIWSYGLHVLLLSIFRPVPFGYMGLEFSLPWLLSALILIAVALNEEIDMKNRYNEDYLTYQAKVPFMFPIPKKIKSILLFPMRKMFNKDLPENKKEILVIILFYGGLLILISFFFELFGWDTLIENAIMKEIW